MHVLLAIVPVVASTVTVIAADSGKKAMIQGCDKFTGHLSSVTSMSLKES